MSLQSTRPLHVRKFAAEFCLPSALLRWCYCCGGPACLPRRYIAAAMFQASPPHHWPHTLPDDLKMDFGQSSPRGAAHEAASPTRLPWTRLRLADLAQPDLEQGYSLSFLSPCTCLSRGQEQNFSLRSTKEVPVALGTWKYWPCRA
jgi:hypothetical protein